VKRQLSFPFKKIVLVLLCLGVVSIYLKGVVRTFESERAADSYEIAGLEKAARLAPGDAEFAHMLGEQFMEDLSTRERAIAEFRTAAELDPLIAQDWLDLAAAYQVSGDATRQNQALDAALKAEPNNPDIAAEVGQYYLIAGETERALPLFRQAMEIDPSAAANLIPICWRATRDVQLLLNEAIPANADAQLTFLRLLTQQNESAAAGQVWHSLLAARQPFPEQQAFFYFDYLIAGRDVQGMVQQWRNLASRFPDLQNYQPADNPVVNPGFEQPLLDAGFDWRYAASPDVTAGIDESMAHSGTRSLSVLYNGSPAYEAGWQQFVAVEPGAEYNFSAWIRSENLQSSSGPRLAIVDAYSGATFMLTDDVLDTSPWHEVTGTFHVAPDVHLITIKIIRAPSNTGIRGRVWIDDLRLTRK
jgi:tetratricopeptide (TPR) repeat protein